MFSITMSKSKVFSMFRDLESKYGGVYNCLKSVLAIFKSSAIASNIHFTILSVGMWQHRTGLLPA